MGESQHYVIRGGLDGRERLRLLARIMQESSSSLFDRLHLANGMTCLDVGCGGGDATLELSRRVAPLGKAVGYDIDQTKLEIARAEARQQGILNVEFHLSDIREASPTAKYDIVYSRFLLTHLNDPVAAVSTFFRHLRPGGLLAVEDIDFSGYFTYPESRAFRRYHELYCSAVRLRGGDPNIGPRLPSFLKRAGFQDIGVSVVQPMAIEGDVKLINPLTMENIADTVLDDGSATQAEIDEVVRELYEFAVDPNTLSGMPRVVQTWGRRPVHLTQV